MKPDSRLYYFHDPMCSWCWAFAPALREVESRLPDGMRLTRVLGGLAPDTEEPMPPGLRDKLQAIWKTIQIRVPGTRFNFRYWEVCTPRRSTHPACRAVIAASRQGDHEEPMIDAIQRAYYLRAMNPSDRSTLIALAGELGLDVQCFEHDLDHPDTQTELEQQIAFGRERGVRGFPTLLLETSGEWQAIEIDPNQPDFILAQLRTR
ncbi:DsbA family protein [Methylolobus aquaticus]